MIVIERDFLARWVREMKQRQDSGNRDFYTGYMSAMSTVEGMLAMCPEYDLEKLIEDAVKRAEERERYEMDELAMGF